MNCTGCTCNAESPSTFSNGGFPQGQQPLNMNAGCQHTICCIACQEQVLKTGWLIYSPLTTCYACQLITLNSAWTRKLEHMSQQPVWVLSDLTSASRLPSVITSSHPLSQCPTCMAHAHQTIKLRLYAWHCQDNTKYMSLWGHRCYFRVCRWGLQQSPKAS